MLTELDREIAGARRELEAQIVAHLAAEQCVSTPDIRAEVSIPEVLIATSRAKRGLRRKYVLRNSLQRLRRCGVIRYINSGSGPREFGLWELDGSSGPRAPDVIASARKTLQRELLQMVHDLGLVRFERLQATVKPPEVLIRANASSGPRIQVLKNAVDSLRRKGFVRQVVRKKWGISVQGLAELRRPMED